MAELGNFPGGLGKLPQSASVWFRGLLDSSVLVIQQHGGWQDRARELHTWASACTD